MRRARRRRDGFVLAFMILSTIGCASWQEQATLATGLCRGRSVKVFDTREHEGEPDSWHASCGSGTFRCQTDGGDQVVCDYVPICGNDGHAETHRGHYPR